MPNGARRDSKQLVKAAGYCLGDYLRSQPSWPQRQLPVLSWRGQAPSSILESNTSYALSHLSHSHSASQCRTVIATFHSPNSETRSIQALFSAQRFQGSGSQDAYPRLFIRIAEVKIIQPWMTLELLLQIIERNSKISSPGGLQPGILR